MFDRNTDAAQQMLAIPAEIQTLRDGTLRGRLLISRSRDLPGVLNGPDAFLLFEPFGKSRLYLAKQSIAEITPLDAATVPAISADAVDPAGFDPYRILGLGRNATPDAIRAAFIALSKDYHPDRFATVDLPVEITRYLDAMARRINAAYAALTRQPIEEKRTAAEYAAADTRAS